MGLIHQWAPNCEPLPGNPWEYKLFRPVIKYLKATRVVELGAETGMSAKEICMGLEDVSPSGILVSVDIVDRSGFLQPYRNCIHIVGDSREVGKMWRTPIDLLYIDTDHTTPQVLSELEAWESHVKSCIMFHDTDEYPAVMDAINIWLKAGADQHWTFEHYEPPLFGMGVAWRR